MNQSRPGSLSRFMQKNRVMPWYTNTFGTRKSQMTMQEHEDVTDEETEEPKEGLVGWLKSVFGAEEDEIEDIQKTLQVCKRHRREKVIGRSWRWV